MRMAISWWEKLVPDDEPTQRWPSLLLALEAHANTIADLIRSGWTLRAKFAEGEAA
jgi:hypothetical protein